MAAEDKHVALGFLWRHDKILLYLRDNSPHISYPDYWSPLGGQVEAGETPQQALERELQEEIGCGGHSFSYLGPLEVANNPLCEDHTIHVFQGRIDHELDEMHLTEGQKIDYFTFEEFLTAKFPDFLRTFILKHMKPMKPTNQ